MRTCPLLIPALALSLAAGAAHAADGTYEINEDCMMAGCFAGDAPGSPVTIANSGSYRLTSDLDRTIAIAASATEVDLDLGGFSLDGGNRCSGNPVTTACMVVNGTSALTLAAQSAGVYYHLHLHHGRLRGFDGVVLNSLGTGSLVEDVTVSDMSNSVSAVNIDKTEQGATIVVRNVRIVRNRGSGWSQFMNPGLTLWTTVIEGSTFAGNGVNGASVYGGSVVTGSRFLGNNNYGLTCSGNNAAPGVTSLVQNTFLGNKPAVANSEYTCVPIGGQSNYCLDGACP
jgi:hypothetical protein